jgi:predicted ester cyclase
MNQDEMLKEFMRHRDAEIRRDYDAIIDTFVEDCYIETVALGLRSEGREATRTAYMAYFTAFPDLDSDYQGFAAGGDVLVGWGVLSGSSGGEWLGVAPTGGRFAVRFTNVATFRDGQMAGESIFFDVATLCEQAGFSLADVRAAAKARAAGAGLR